MSLARFKLHHQILAAMVLGALIGLPLNIMASSGGIDPEIATKVAGLGHSVGDLFLRLLKMVVVPLIIASLVTGVSSIGDLGALGRLGSRTITYYLVTSLTAITIGIIAVNVIAPGKGVPLLALEEDAQTQSLPSLVDDERSIGDVLWDQLTHMIPTNPVAASAEGDVLPTIFFSLLLGIFISVSLRSAETDSPIHRGVESLHRFFVGLFEIMMRMTMFIIGFAPIGVFGFMLYAAAGHGIDTFKALGFYALTVFVGLFVHAVFVLPLLLKVLGRRSPWQFAQQMSPALLTAFSTASSNATLPLTITCIEERAGIDNRISSFVLPLGATINMDGTALYEAVAVLFIAQVYGLDLSLSQQLVVALTALLASIGAAGIPHAGTVMMVVVLGAVGLPSTAVGLILAVDRVLDMCRTSVNVWSDATAAAVIAHYHGAASPTSPAPASQVPGTVSASDDRGAPDGSERKRTDT